MCIVCLTRKEEMKSIFNKMISVTNMRFLYCHNQNGELCHVVDKKWVLENVFHSFNIKGRNCKFYISVVGVEKVVCPSIQIIWDDI